MRDENEGKGSNGKGCRRSHEWPSGRDVWFVDDEEAETSHDIDD